MCLVWYNSCLRSTDIGSRAGLASFASTPLRLGLFDAEHIIPEEREVCEIVAWSR
jgi:hypothetical protein